MAAHLLTRRWGRRPPSAPRYGPPRWAWLVGAVLAVSLVVAAGEAYLRWFPPADIDQYLGEASAAAGPFLRDKRFGVQYRDWPAFVDANAERLTPHLPPAGHLDRRPVWALFGNSFVQAPGMLGDHVRRNVPQRRAFYLGRNEPLYVRFAQIDLLLQQGFRPERVFVELMPLDAGVLGRHPLADLRVTPRGGLGYQPPVPPGMLGGMVNSSRLGLTAWQRFGRPLPPANHYGRRLTRHVPRGLLADLDHLFGHLAAVTQEAGVPVTVLLLPTHEQVLRGAELAFQNTLAPLLRGHRFDVCDPRSVFLDHPDRPGLFIPDKHYSPTGNRLLLHALLDHLAATGQLPADLAEGGR